MVFIYCLPVYHHFFFGILSNLFFQSTQSELVVSNGTSAPHGRSTSHTPDVIHTHFDAHGSVL
jgi:hypothetical protein